MNRWIVSVVMSCAFCAGAAGAEEAVASAQVPSKEAVQSFAALSLEARRAFVARTPPAQVEALLRAMSVDELLETAARRIQELGTYASTLEKQERVDGTLIATQVIKVVVREKPFAVRMEYEKGPGKGRRVVYAADSAHPKEIRVREAGLFSLAGALWIDVDSSLTRKESNHPVTDMGLGALVRLVRKDAEVYQHQGFTRTDEPLAGSRQFCTRLAPPAAGAPGNAPTTRMCFDVETGIPTTLVVTDVGGVRERYVWKDVERKSPGRDFFTPKAAGL